MGEGHGHVMAVVMIMVIGHGSWSWVMGHGHGHGSWGGMHSSLTSNRPQNGPKQNAWDNRNGKQAWDNALKPKVRGSSPT